MSPSIIDSMFTFCYYTSCLAQYYLLLAYPLPLVNCKYTILQVKFVYEAFRKLRPGVPLKCLHGRMKLEKRIGIYSQFREEKRSVLFSTDVASRGLDFNKAVDWVVQVRCKVIEEANT